MREEGHNHPRIHRCVYAGHIVISDVIKANAAAAIDALHKNGIRRTVMLTGDAKSVADQVAAELSLDEVYSELLPQDKVAKVEALLRQEQGGKLAFVGDGINDAPVLSRATSASRWARWALMQPSKLPMSC